MDRRELLRVFRQRLTESMSRAGLTQSALARRIGVDRSTLAQFLAPNNKRLPRADTLSGSGRRPAGQRRLAAGPDGGGAA